MRTLINIVDCVGKTIERVDCDFGVLSIHLIDGSSLAILVESEVDDDADFSVVEDMDELDSDVALSVGLIDESEKKAHVEERLARKREKLRKDMEKIVLSDPTTRKWLADLLAGHEMTS